MAQNLLGPVCPVLLTVPGSPVPRALSATEALADLKVVEAIVDAAAAKSVAGTRVAA